MPYARARPVISGPSTHDNILNPAPTAFPRGPEGGPCTSPLVLALRKWEPLPILCLLNVFNRVIAADITNWTMKEMAAHRDFERGDRRIFSSRDWGCCLPNICSYYIYIYIHSNRGKDCEKLKSIKNNYSNRKMLHMIHILSHDA